MKSESFLGAMRRFFADYLGALETRGPFGRLVRLAAEDPELRHRLHVDPDATLSEHGVTLPEGVHAEFLENTETVVHLVLPPYVGPVSEEGSR